MRHRKYFNGEIRMRLSKIWVLGLCICLTIVACQPLPDRSVRPTVSASPSPGSSATSATSSNVPATTSPAVTPSVVPTVVASQDEEDCMAGCHVPDANESYAEGAKPQPATHVNLTTCLNCHATLQTPSLPASHLGRLDPSCATCHLPSSP